MSFCDQIFLRKQTVAADLKTKTKQIKVSKSNSSFIQPSHEMNSSWIEEPHSDALEINADEVSWRQIRFQKFSSYCDFEIYLN